MICIENYIYHLIEELQKQFASRLLYVGLQGSYVRGEATEDSDIDIMVVVDALDVTDLDRYRATIASMEFFEKSCGFICGKSDLMNWNPLELHHLLYSTKDYYGILRELVPEYSEENIRDFVKLSVGNLYHEICHRYVHSVNNADISRLSQNYKNVFYILQNLFYLSSGEFISTKTELLNRLDGKNYAVLKRSMDMNAGILFDFSDSFELLFKWCQEILMLGKKITSKN